MSPESTRRLQDALAKLDAKSKLIAGGAQYTPAVSLQVASINKGKALMRNQKHEGARPLPLHALQRKQK